MKDISIVIVNLNGAEFISSCLESIEMKYVKEIIVVDNASIDSSVKVIEDFSKDVIIIKNTQNLGFAGPANQGGFAAGGEFILFLNNDVRIQPGTLKGLRDAMSDTNVAVVGPLLLSNDGLFLNAGSFLTRTGFLHHLTEHEAHLLKDSEHRFAVQGACMLVRKKCFEEIGGFDSEFFAYFEESDLCWRLNSIGYATVCKIDLTAVHDGGRTSSKIFTSDYLDFLSFRNRFRSIDRNLSGYSRIYVMTSYCICSLIFSTLYLLRGKIRNCFSIIKALLTYRNNYNINQARTIKRKFSYYQKLTAKPNVKQGIKSVTHYVETR